MRGRDNKARQAIYILDCCLTSPKYDLPPESKWPGTNPAMTTI
jgi:hypothetical protein